MSYINRILLCVVVSSVAAFASPSVQGIHNFRQVDSHVYRGGQPDGAGYQYLAKLGVKTVLDLREPGERASEEAQMVSAQGMKYVNIPMSGLTPPTQDQITKILAMLEDGSTGAVFVHCMRGADRTGAVIAAYRIDHNHWTNDRALQEADADGMSFFQFPRKGFIRNFHPQVIEAEANSGAKAAPKSGEATLPASTTPAVALAAGPTAQ